MTDKSNEGLFYCSWAGQIWTVHSSPTQHPFLGTILGGFCQNQPILSTCSKPFSFSHAIFLPLNTFHLSGNKSEPFWAGLSWSPRRWLWEPPPICLRRPSTCLGSLLLTIFTITARCWTGRESTSLCRLFTHLIGSDLFIRGTRNISWWHYFWKTKSLFCRTI